jgi:hypothetical protein
MAIANIITTLNMVGWYSLEFNDYNTDQFNSFVTDEQYQLLIEMLGVELYNTYSTTPTTTAWVNLRDGVNGYTNYEGYIKNWNGLAYLLTPFIFYKYMELNEFKQSITGTIIAENENSVKASEYQRKQVMYRAWNEFVKRWYECFDFLYTYNSTYTDFDLWFREKKCKLIINKGSIS